MFSPFADNAKHLLKNPGFAMLLVILGTALMRIVFGSVLGLGIDESYMVAAGREFRLGYFDHPPASWWLFWAAEELTGSDAALIVRLPFIALFALSTWLIYRLTSILFSPRAGFWAAVALNLSAVFGVADGTFVLPDGPMIAALLGAALCLVRALPSRDKTAFFWWLGAGICAGLALFSKYSASLSLLGVGLYIVTQRQHRHWLAQPAPYAAALAAILVFSPVLVWNATHGWASFFYQGGRARLAEFHIFGPVRTLAGEALFLLPWIWVPLIIELVDAIRRGPSDWRRWLLFCLAIVPIAFFTLVSLWSSGRVQFHWATPGYLMLFPLLGESVAGQLSRKDRLTRIWLKASVVFVCVALCLVVANIRYNAFGDLIGAVNHGRDPTLDVLEWTELRDDLTARGLLAGPGIPLAATNWRDAGKADYALEGKIEVFCLCADRRQYGFRVAPGTIVGRDVLLLGPSDDPSLVPRQYSNLFEWIEVLAPVTVERTDHPKWQLSLFLGHRLLAWPAPPSARAAQGVPDPGSGS